ncbi:MAG: glycine cleavage system protein GcvH [Alloprevotella sp.]|nr:glycine cleavage system protein GcvH [Alloprevotella sp.]
MAEIKAGYLYSESHEYVKVEGEFAYIGITDYAQDQLGNVTYVEIPEVGEEITAGEDFGSVESVKAASELTAPVSGEIVEVNTALDNAPQLLNEDAFANWIIKVRMSNADELNDLLDGEKYAAICE